MKQQQFKLLYIEKWLPITRAGIDGSGVGLMDETTPKAPISGFKSHWGSTYRMGTNSNTTVLYT